jgi:hypothetical protein
MELDNNNLPNTRCPQVETIFVTVASLLPSGTFIPVGMQCVLFNRTVTSRCSGTAVSFRIWPHLRGSARDTPCSTRAFPLEGKNLTSISIERSCILTCTLYLLEVSQPAHHRKTLARSILKLVQNINASMSNSSSWERKEKDMKHK